MEMFSQINDRELPVLAQSIIDTTEEPTADSVMRQLTLIDDLLNFQRTRMLFMPRRTKAGNLRKDATLKQIIEKRIENEI